MSRLDSMAGRWPGGIHHIGCGGASATTAHCCRPVASDGILLRTCAAVVCSAVLRHLDPKARARPTSFNRPRPDRLSPPNAAPAAAPAYGAAAHCLIVGWGASRVSMRVVCARVRSHSQHNIMGLSEGVRGVCSPRRSKAGRPNPTKRCRRRGPLDYTQPVRRDRSSAYAVDVLRGAPIAMPRRPRISIIGRGRCARATADAERLACNGCAAGAKARDEPSVHVHHFPPLD